MTPRRPMPKRHFNRWPPCLVWRDDDPKRLSFAAFVGFVYAKDWRVLSHELTHQAHIQAFAAAGVVVMSLVVWVVGLSVFWILAGIPLGNGAIGIAVWRNILRFGVWTEVMSEASEAKWELDHGQWPIHEAPNRCFQKIDGRWEAFSKKWKLTDVDWIWARNLCLKRFYELVGR